MALVRLDDVEGFGDDVDGAFREMREAIEGSHNWRVTGPVKFLNTPGYKSLLVKSYPGAITAVVATGGITARVNSTTDGVGNAVLWHRAPGTAVRTAGLTVKVYNSLAVLVPAGTFIKILPAEAGDYELVSGDCP